MNTNVELKHTQGPWLFSISTPKQESEKWGGNCGADAHIFTYTTNILMGRPSTKTIAFMPHWRNESENEENIANAKLIAAAPDLLEALQDVISNAPDNFHIPTWDKVLSAIQKATL